jgi:hypothetical protein
MRLETQHPAIAVDGRPIVEPVDALVAQTRSASHGGCARTLSRRRI